MEWVLFFYEIGMFPLSCEICDPVDHMTVNFYVESPFVQDPSDQVSYVNNFNLQLSNDPFSNN